MVLTSIHSALRAMSDTSAMTSGEDARTSRRNSLRASLSPASAFSERALSSARRPLTSSESSSAPGTSPLSFVFAVSSVHQVGCYEYLCRLRDLLERGDQTLQPLQLRPLSLSLRPSAGSPEYVRLGADAGELPRPDVDLAYPLAVADAAIVVESAVPALECHVRVLLQSRGIRKNVVHTNLRRQFGARSRVHLGAEDLLRSSRWQASGLQVPASPLRPPVPSVSALESCFVSPCCYFRLVFHQLRGLARRRRASEIAVQGHPDWFVVYQHGLLLQTNVCARIMPCFSEVFIFSVWPVRTGANRDSARHSNFPKQYAAASAETKKAAAHNHASPLASYLTQMAVTTALTTAKMLDATSNPK